MATRALPTRAASTPLICARWESCCSSARRRAHRATSSARIGCARPSCAWGWSSLTRACSGAWCHRRRPLPLGRRPRAGGPRARGVPSQAQTLPRAARCLLARHSGERSRQLPERSRLPRRQVGGATWTRRSSWLGLSRWGRSATCIAAGSCGTPPSCDPASRMAGRSFAHVVCSDAMSSGVGACRLARPQEIGTSFSSVSVLRPLWFITVSRRVYIP